MWGYIALASDAAQPAMFKSIAEEAFRTKWKAGGGWRAFEMADLDVARFLAGLQQD